MSTESSFSTPKRPQDSIFMLISNYTHSWHNLFNVNRIESIHRNLNLILDADLFPQRNLLGLLFLDKMVYISAQPNWMADELE